MKIDLQTMNEVRTPEQWKSRARDLWEIEPHVKRKSPLRPALIAAVLCLCAGTAAAAVNGVPVLGSYYDNSAGYEDSSFVVGESVTSDGWTMTLNDVVADDYNFYAGFTLTAPEGTVLDAEEYRLSASKYLTDTYSVSLADYDVEIVGENVGWYSSVLFTDDENPEDNQIQFLFALYGDLGNNAESLIGKQVKMSFHGLTHQEWNEELQDYEPIVDSSADWNFKFTLDANSERTISMNPNEEISTLGVNATITEIKVSPLGVTVRIEGEELRNHHDWVEVKDGDYDCHSQEIILYTTDGQEIRVPTNGTGSGCSETLEEYDGTPYVFISRVYDDYQLVDVNTLEAISIEGVKIQFH